MKIPFILGINHIPDSQVKLTCPNKSIISMKDSIINNESILENMIKDYKIDSFQSLFTDGHKFMNSQGFSYEKYQ